jgi:thioredoxin reductase (NADPH)
LSRRSDVVILGGGPAGMAAAIWCKRLGLSHLLLEGRETLGGQLLAIHNQVIDYPGLPAANGQEVQAAFAEHVKTLGCEVETGVQALQADVARRVLTVRSEAGDLEEISYQSLIVATGASDRRLGVPGEQAMIARGEVYSASRDRGRFVGKKVAVVGGGDRALEGALLLAERGADVVLIHRSDRYRAREEFLQPVMAHPKIERVTHARVKRILGEEAVSGVEIVTADGAVRRLDVAALFVRIGVEPNSHLLRGQVETDADGYLLTDETGRTSAEGVFAIGDVCTRPFYSSIATAVGQAMAAVKRLSLGMKQEEEEL